MTTEDKSFLAALSCLILLFATVVLIGCTANETEYTKIDNNCVVEKNIIRNITGDGHTTSRILCEK